MDPWCSLKTLKLLFLCVVVSFAVHAQNRTYYISESHGSDLAIGTSPDKAWRSLAKVNEVTFLPGDKLLFKSGDVWHGQFEPKGSGTASRPIRIDRFGKGPKPRLEGGGHKLFTVRLNNNQYVQLCNLEITNTGVQVQAKRVGVWVRAWDMGDCHGILLDGLEIHDVNGSLVKKEGAGSAIFWENGGETVKSRFIGLTIQNCHLYQTQRNGITASGYARRDQWYPSLNVLIRNNVLEGIPGDGIVPIGTDGCVIEHNLLRDSPDILPFGDAAAGIWPWSADNTLIRFNEVSGQKAKWDGQGFDSDYNCSNTVIEYNYSHDNYGGFLLICNEGNSLGGPWNKGTKGTIVRHNISINDGIRPYQTKRKDWFSPVVHMAGPIAQTQFSDNIILVTAKADPKIDQTYICMDHWGEGWPENTELFNNIFYSERDSMVFDFSHDIGTQMKENHIIGPVYTPSYEAYAKFNKKEQGQIPISKIRDFLQGKKLNKGHFRKVRRIVDSKKGY
jgi:hypothetical protein